MIRVILVRHAECVANLTVTKIVGGRQNESPLTKRGEEQAAVTGKYVKQKYLKLNKVFASPAVRTRETARIICSEHQNYNKEVEYSDALQEISQGDWEGKPRDECHTVEVIQRMKTEGWDFKGPGGESLREVENRMVSFIESKIKPLVNHDAKEIPNILVVSHGIAIKCLLKSLLGASGKLVFRYRLDNCGISSFLYEAKFGGWAIQSWNETYHLLQHGLLDDFTD